MYGCAVGLNSEGRAKSLAHLHFQSLGQTGGYSQLECPHNWIFVHLSSTLVNLWALGGIKRSVTVA